MRRVSMPSALFSAPDFKHHNPDFQDCDTKVGIVRNVSKLYHNNLITIIYSLIIRKIRAYLVNLEK